LFNMTKIWTRITTLMLEIQFFRCLICEVVSLALKTVYGIQNSFRFRLNSSPAAWLTCLLCSRDQRSESGQLVLKLYTNRLHAECVVARRRTSTCGWWSYAVVCSKGTRSVTSVTGWLTCLRRAPHSIPGMICDNCLAVCSVLASMIALSFTISYPVNGLLSPFGKLQKITINFVMSLCLSVRLSPWNMSAPTGRIFMKFDIWIFFENLLRKFKFHWNMTRITGNILDKIRM